jgi:hypothetical protein
MRGTQCSVPPLHLIRKFSAKICRIRLIGWLGQGTTRACGRDDEYYASWRFQKAALAMIKAQGGIFGWVSDSKRALTALAV